MESLTTTKSKILEDSEEDELRRELFGEESENLAGRAEAFGEILVKLFDTRKKEYQRDFAVIAAFLSCPNLFETAFRAMDSDLRRVMIARERARYFNPNGTVNLARIQGHPGGKPTNKLANSFVDLFELYGHGGFPRVHNLVMVGSSFKVFGAIIANGLLFKDGTGPGHGEYTHTLQWLTVAKANKLGLLKLDHTVFQIYSSCAGPGTLTPPKVKLKRGDQDEPTQVTFWQVLVDCFPQTVKDREDPLVNLMSDSYRTPSYFTRSLKIGPLSSTFMAEHLNRRVVNRYEHFRSAEALRKYHAEKQKRLGRRSNVSEGVNIFVPDNAPEPFFEDLLQRGVHLE